MTGVAHQPLGAGEARSVAAIVDELAYRPGRGGGTHPVVTTGFDLVDATLGGLRAGDLVVVGGVPGVGKTVATLQWARHMAATGHAVVYACYEHDEADLLGRLLAAEVAEAATASDLPRLDGVRARVLDALNGGDLVAVASDEPLLRAAVGRLDAYADNLHLVRASGAHTDTGVLSAIVAETGADVLFVDYLQKVPTCPAPAEESERVTLVAGALKELALSRGVAVVAAAAASRRGLEAQRLRLHHLRGSSALAYEADAVVILNPKSTCVSKAHRAYDPLRAETFRQWVVFTVEKNRSGPNLVDLEFRTDFASFRFEPRGGYVVERLVDERLHEE